MHEFYDQRGNYQVRCYTIDITERMKKVAMDFAVAIVLSDNQYSRLLPTMVRVSGNLELQQKMEIQRTYIGKLGEIAFAQLLSEHGKNVNTDGMFQIYKGQSNVDSYDFITKNEQSVDVKTGFRNIHRRLAVNIEQFNRDPKNFYVGVKLHAIDVNSKLKLVDWDHIAKADILGYADYQYMKKYAKIQDFGEGLARWLWYQSLMGIDRLIDQF